MKTVIEFLKRNVKVAVTIAILGIGVTVAYSSVDGCSVDVEQSE